MDTRGCLPFDVPNSRNGSTLLEKSQLTNIPWSNCDAAAASSDTLLHHMQNTLLGSQAMSPVSSQGSNVINAQSSSSGLPSLVNNLFLPPRPNQVKSQQIILGAFPASPNLNGNIFDHPLFKNSSMQTRQTQEAKPNGDIKNFARENSTLSLLDDSLETLLKDESFGLDSDDCSPLLHQDPSALFLAKDYLTTPMPKRICPTGNMLPDVKRQRTGYEQSSRAPRFRPYQEKQWQEQFEELLKFKEEHGHCLVPHTFQENQTLSRWVKRQRYQYKLMKEHKVTTMTDRRVVQLEEVGFVWDSHAATWQERLGELEKYFKKHGDVHVPSNYPENPQLATWVKCQRRQGKLFFNGKPSNMNRERATALNRLGFSWGTRHEL